MALIVRAVLLAAVLVAPLEDALSLESPVTHYHQTTQRPYDDVLDDVRLAIVEHNFRITGENRVGGAIAERHGIDFPRSHVVHFCNLEYARQFIEADPDSLLAMPCRVVVYERQGRVVVAAPLVSPTANNPEAAGLAERVNAILKAIVDFAAEGW